MNRVCSCLIFLAWLVGSCQATDPCPAWLEEYKTWHAENRGSPSATYILFDCSNGVRCNGVGDRIKSITYLLRVAALYRKVLLVAWEIPVPVEEYLQPNQIDWTLKGLDRDMLLEQEHAGSELFKVGMNVLESPAVGDLLRKQEHVEEFKQLKVWRTQLLFEPQHPIRGSDDNEFIEEHGKLHFARCLFTFLFTPVSSIMEEAQGVVQRLYGQPHTPYIAWHWRTGGLVNEPILDRKSTTHSQDSSRLRQIMSVIACAETMPATLANDSQIYIPPPSEQPLLLVTDHNLLRSFIAAGNLQRITATNDTVAHTRQGSKYRGGTAESVHTSWVDLAILAQADCLVYSHSGYSLVALWMGTSHCHMHLDICLTKQKLMFKGVEVRRQHRR